MRGISKLTRYLKYAQEQEDNTAEELTQAIEAWDEKNLPEKVLCSYASVLTGDYTEIRAAAAKSILENRKKS